MLQTLMAAMGSNNQQTKVLSGRVDGIEQKPGQIDEKADRIIAALEKAGVAVSPDAAAPTTAPAATPASPDGGTKPPAQNPWMTATSGGGRGGGSSKRKPGRGMGGTVSEDYDGLDDDDEVMPLTMAARTRGSIARRVDAARSCSARQARPRPPERLALTHVNRHSALSSRGPSVSNCCTTSVTEVMSVEGLRGETGRSWLREAGPPQRPEEAGLGVYLTLADRPTEN